MKKQFKLAILAGVLLTMFVGCDKKATNTPIKPIEKPPIEKASIDKTPVDKAPIETPSVEVETKAPSSC